MGTATRYVRGIAAAAAGAGTLLLFVLISFPQGPSIFGFGEVIGLFAANTIVSVLIGAPTIFVLAKMAALRWSTVSGVWALASAGLVGGFFLLIPKDDWFFGGATFLETALISAAASVVGWLCGFACWFAIREAHAS